MLKRIFTSACVLFTAMVTCYSLIILLLYSADPESSLALSAARIFLFFPFALAFSAANQILSVEKMDKWLRTVLHFIVTATASYLCLLLPMGGDVTPTVMLVGMFLFLVIYAAVFAVLALIRAKAAKAANAEKEYTPVYRKGIDKK